MATPAPSQTSIKIIIPVHDEEGWTTACSPDAGASLKARLQEGKSPKSPATRRRMEERAAQLHQLHVEATQQRAAKENRRAKEVVAARLRSAAASRQNLLARFEEQASHREEKQRLKQQHQTERQALRKNTAAAAHAARAAAQAEKEHRLAVIRSREEECARQAEKARQQRVQRVAYHLKQALAKATAIKEGRKESLEVKQERMLARLGAAEERREELTKEVAAQGSALLADKAAHAQRAAQREAALRAERSQLAMAAAAARREEAINARVRLQARLAPTKESKEAEKDRAEAVDAVLRRRALFERLNAADHRRALLL